MSLRPYLVSANSEDVGVTARLSRRNFSTWQEVPAENVDNVDVSAFILVPHKRLIKFHKGSFYRTQLEFSFVLWFNVWQHIHV